MMSAGRDSICSKVKRAEKNGIKGEGADGQAIAVFPEIIELKVGGGVGGSEGIVEQSVARVAVVVAALSLILPDFGEFGIGIDALVAARAEEDLRLAREIALQKQTEAYGRAVLQRNQAGGRARRRIKVRRIGERRSDRAVGNFSVVVRGVVVEGDAQLPQVRDTGNFPGALFRGGKSGEQQAREKGDDRNDGE